MTRQKICSIVPIILLLILTIPAAMADTVNIKIDMDGNANVHIQNDNGTFSIVYNGRDILGELEAAKKSINDMEKTFIYWAGQRKAHEQDILIVEEQLNNLTRDLNIVLGDLYGNLGYTMHVVGINQGNSSVAIQLIAGNATVAEYIDDIMYDVDSLSFSLGDLQLNVTEGRELMEENTFTIDKISNKITILTSVLDDTIEDMEANFVNQLTEHVATLQTADESFDRRISEEIEIKDTQIEQLESELYVLNREFESQKLVSFGGFGIVVFLLLGLYVIFARGRNGSTAIE